MQKFAKWLTLMESNTAEAGDVVPVDQSDARIQTLHDLQQQHSEQHPVFQAIYDNVKKLTNTAQPQEADRLNEAYTTLAARYRVILVIYIGEQSSTQGAELPTLNFKLL